MEGGYILLIFVSLNRNLKQSHYVFKKSFAAYITNYIVFCFFTGTPSGW